MVFSHLMGSPVYTRRQLAGQIYRHMHLAAAGRSGYSAASQCVGLDEAMFKWPQISAGFHRKQAEDESMKSRKKKRLKADVKSLEVQRDMALAFIKSEKGQKVFSWVFQIVLVLALAAVVAIFFFQSIVMQESSMEPTFQTGEKFFINKMAYKLGSPKRGDIIAFTKDGKDNSAIHIKRVIGLPGERIQIREGKIYIDGEEYKEEGDFPQITNPGLAEDGVTLKSNEYFVLGDNRNNSEDSRFAEVKNVNKKYIEGKVWFCISPFQKMGFVKH